MTSRRALRSRRHELAQQTDNGVRAEAPPLAGRFFLASNPGDRMRKTVLSCGAAFIALGVAGSAAAADLSEIGGAITGGKLILDMRGRHEHVEQAGFADDAEAVTLRTRLGWETASWNGVKALVEFEDVRSLGADRYNDGVPPAEAYPVIADPEVTELNRAQLTWTPSKTFSATIGRQRINFDDQRFVGAVGWRQDEQTFDAARTDITLGKLKVAVVYIDQANRIFAEALDFESESWLVNASYPVSDLFTPTAFVYALDFENAPASSTLTTGVRVTGKTAAGAVTLSWAGSYASQSEHGSNTGNFDLDYIAAELSAGLGPFTVKGAYESLEGDGVRGFATPLATMHAFQGWADVFLTTPAAGIEDANLTLAYKAPINAPQFSNLVLTARYHDFQTELTGADLGSELDFMATAQITPRLSAVAKYADYDGVPGFADRQKFWLGFEFKL